MHGARHLFLKQQDTAKAQQNPAAKQPNQQTRRNFRRSLTSAARIASFITAAAALIPAQAQAAAAGGAYRGAVKKTIKTMPFRASYNIEAYAPDRPISRNSERGDIIPASLGGFARALPAGIYPASPGVATGCFNGRMNSLLATIQHKYRRPVIITSGYRGIIHNIRAGGVRGSLHTACAAADIKVPGVNKYQLAAFVRSLPNRGGVGLYCHQAVHVDIGSPRDWNWCAVRRGKTRRG